MAYEFRCVQHNYQHAMNADNVTVDSQLDALSEAGWEIVNSDVSGWPYVTILWRREKKEKKS